MPEQLEATITFYRDVAEARIRALLKDKDGEAGFGQSLEGLVLLGIGITIALGIGVWLAALVINKESTIAP
jgi:hypothetical protein